MFDIDVPGGIKFTESDVLSPGNSLEMFEIGMVLINWNCCHFPTICLESFCGGVKFWWKEKLKNFSRNILIILTKRTPS